MVLSIFLHFWVNLQSSDWFIHCMWDSFQWDGQMLKKEVNISLKDDGNVSVWNSTTDDMNVSVCNSTEIHLHVLCGIILQGFLVVESVFCSMPNRSKLSWLVCQQSGWYINGILQWAAFKPGAWSVCSSNTYISLNLWLNQFITQQWSLRWSPSFPFPYLTFPPSPYPFPHPNIPGEITRNQRMLYAPCEPGVHTHKGIGLEVLKWQNETRSPTDLFRAQG